MMISTGVLIATILGSSMVFIDGSVVNVIMPLLQKEFGVSAVEIQWVVESYLLFLSALILIGGSLGDHFGRKKIFLLGSVIFVLSSIGCGFSQSLWWMTFFRSLQGVGGALLTPGSLAIINSVFPKGQRGKAIGTWSGFSAITTALGPVLGGWLSDHASWRWVFFINVPLGLGVIYFTHRYIPEKCHETGKEPLDFWGVLISILGIGSFVYGLIEKEIFFGVIGIGFLLVFLLIEFKTKTPLIPLTFFKSREFVAINVSTFFLYAALSAVFYFLPFNLIQIQGFSATEAGAANLPFVFLIFFGSRWAGNWYDKVGAKIPLTVGSLIVGVGFFVLGFLPGIHAHYWRDFFPGIVLFGIGMSMCISPLTTAVLAAVSEEKSGLSSGINNAVTRIAGLLAVAVMTILMVVIFQHYLRNTAFDTLTKNKLLEQASELAALKDQRKAVQDIIHLSYLKSFRDIMCSSALLAWISGLNSFLFLKSKTNLNA